MENLSYFVLLALLAEILGTVGGFGSSLFFIPIATYFLDFHSALGITALFHVSSNISKIFFFKKGFDKKTVISIGIPSIIFVILGALLSKILETKMLEILLAIFLIATSSLLLFIKHITIKPTTINSVGGGMLSGFIAGLLGTGGAIRGVVLSAYGLTIETFIATSAIIDLGVDLSRSIVYSFNGYVHQHDLYLIPILLAVSIAGTFIGKKILTKISEKQFNVIVLILVLMTGVSTLVKVLLQ